MAASVLGGAVWWQAATGSCVGCGWAGLDTQAAAHSTQDQPEDYIDLTNEN